MADLVALGYLESYEAVTLVATTSFTVNIVAGMSFAAGDTLSVTWSTSSSMSSPTTTATTSLTGKVLGDAVTRAVTGLSTNTTYYYQVNIAIAATSTTYTGAVRTMTTQPGTSATVRIGLYSDSHYLDAVNAGQTVKRAVHAQTISNLITDAPGLLIDAGDNTPHAHFNTQHAVIFPINKDGASVSASSRYATAQSDCDYDVRIWRRNASTMHTFGMVAKAVGNHDGEHKSSTTATYSRTAWNTYFGNMNSTALWGGDSTGRYGSFQWGPVLVCIFNPYIDTNMAVADNDAPAAQDNWCLSDAQWTYFFDASTGVITTASTSTSPFILCCIHNLVGGKAVDATLSSPYGRGGKKYVVDKAGGASGEHGVGAAWTNPRSWTASGDTHGSLGFHKALIKRCNVTGCIPVVVKGHDHFYAREWCDGILYLTMPRTASLNGSPYDSGFKTDGDYSDTDTNTKYAPNSGHVLLTCSPTMMTLQYKRAYVGGLGVSDPSDGIVTNGAIVDQVQVSLATKARSFVSDTARLAEDSVADAAAGVDQTGYPSAGEPTGLTTFNGAEWKLYTTGTATGGPSSSDNRTYLAMRTSTIDGTKSLRSRRPFKATATAVGQAAITKLYGLNREIRVKFASSASSSAIMYVYICAAANGSQASTTNIAAATGSARKKGLVLTYAPSTHTTTLLWDNGTTEYTSASSFVTASPAGAYSSTSYTCPAATAFDAGIRIVLRGRRITVFSPSAKIIDCYLDPALLSDAPFISLRADQTYWYTGVCGRTTNTGAAGYIQEFKDFQARALT